jgi:hypothetical protein
MEIITTLQQRQGALNFALKAYKNLKGHRAYALNDESKNTLAVLARALLDKRKAEDRHDMDGTPGSMKEMIDLLTKLDDAGLNLRQRRAHAPTPIPELWVDPVTKQPLPPPKGLAERSLLAKIAPDLLQHFDVMEREPYAHIQKLRDEEAQRKVIDAIVYDESAHNPAVNPYLSDNLTAKSNFEKSASPELVEFCKREAVPVTLPLFGPDRNMTVQAKLSKNPDTNAIMQIADGIWRQWSFEDMENAKQQKAAAEATLRKFAVS